jgi:ATP-dependent RNA helicase DDX49/DBP8
VGGLDQLTQSKELAERPHIVIATPGRLAELIRSNQRPHFTHLQFLVLDEADRLLESSFQPDLDVILGYLPPVNKRQTLLFSATLNQEAPELQRLQLNAPVTVEAQAGDQEGTVAELDQRYLFVPQSTKESYLIYILTQTAYKDESCIIFTSTCRGAEILTQLLVELSINCVSLHSNHNQARRLAALGKFRSAQTNILIATDIASRGLDIPSVKLVVNYDVPRVAEDYIHRVGRTARAGRGGMAATIVSQYDINIFQHIEETVLARKMEKFDLPEEKVLNLMKTVNAAKKMAKIRLEEFDLTKKTVKRSKRQRETHEADQEETRQSSPPNSHRGKSNLSQQWKPVNSSSNNNFSSSKNGINNSNSSKATPSGNKKSKSTRSTNSNQSNDNEGISIFAR